MASRGSTTQRRAESDPSAGVIQRRPGWVRGALAPAPADGQQGEAKYRAWRVLDPMPAMHEHEPGFSLALRDSSFARKQPHHPKHPPAPSASHTNHRHLPRKRRPPGESWHSCSVWAPRGISGLSPVLHPPGPGPRPREEGVGLAAAQVGAGGGAEMQPAETSTLSSPPAKSSSSKKKKNTQHLWFWSWVFFFFSPSPFYRLLISIFQFQSSKGIFWAQRTHAITPLAAVQTYVCT